MKTKKRYGHIVVKPEQKERVKRLAKDIGTTANKLMDFVIEENCTDPEELVRKFNERRR